MAVRDWPLARRLTALVVLVAGVALLLNVVAFVGFEYWSFRRRAREGLAARSRIVALNSTAALAFYNQEDARETLASLRADPEVVAAALYDRDGALFASYPDDVAPDLLPDSPEADGYRFDGGLLVAFEPVFVTPDDRLGTLYLATGVGSLYRAIRLSGAIGATVFALSLLAVYTLSRVFQGTISLPIRKLAESARVVSSQGDYSVRAPEVSGGELGELTRAFNLMLARIEEQDGALKESKEALEGYAAELEQRVAERTRALEESKSRLERYAAQLETANRELDAFAYSVSHDLRAPLRSIDGFSHILLEDYAEKLDDDGRDCLTRVRAATQRMGTLIDDLLELSRITRAEMHLQEVDLSRMADEIAAELRASNPGRSAEFRIAPGLVANGDRRLLRVALANLLGNSWKYTSRRPDPVIELGTVRIDGELVFVVRDNGAGFDMKYADKLFGEFQRLHSAAEFEGTGVGLATVRRIVERHGGRIWAEGEVDQGASFYFTL
ncbi:MAG TPA: ATP-binding protein [Longimicrobiales bacterium]|nr:ATP-binding protein [Longimicrobiales bacterium]